MMSADLRVHGYCLPHVHWVSRAYMPKTVLRPCSDSKTLITSVLQLHSVIGASKLHSLTQHPSPEHKTFILTAIGYQSLHAQTMTITPPCSKSIWRPEHPCPNHNNVRVLTAFGFQSIPAQTMNDSLRRTIQLSQNSVAKDSCFHDVGGEGLYAWNAAPTQDDFLKAA